jgi:chondroitin AC lyase
MDFSKQDTRAKKAWFWFDDEWVALGAGIASNFEAPVVTGINQTLLNGEVLVDGKPSKKGSQRLENPLWVWHDGVGYILPGDEPVNIKADVQQGNIQRIYGLGKDTVYSHEVFSLWLDHGLKPTDEYYQYIIVPGVGSNDMARYAENIPITVLSNTSEVQAVKHDHLQMTGIVFHQAGEFLIGKDLTAIVEAPCLLLLKEGKISVSDPTTELTEIKITLKRGDGSSQSRLIELPSGGFAGKSVSVELD